MSIEPFGTSLGVREHELPINSRDDLYAGAGWWGSAEWLIKGSAPVRAKPLPEGMVQSYLDLLPGEPATIGDPRWYGEGWAGSPICPGFALSPILFAYAAAATEADEWRMVRTRLRLYGEPVEGAPIVIGLKDREPVALLPAIREEATR